jgi:hypothetical protein
VTGGNGVYLIFQFWLETGHNRMKYCRKIKRWQRARLDSMGKKCDTAWLRGNVGRRRGGTERGKGGYDAN